ncbi:hypothetical protein [Marinobacter nauticus]|uniref:Uncharacterized protein n=1 Tax=Marinobacter nauticus (strain ATCC 700491 / DSM 11845 / VT8) TaxID=351348 RepID=A1U7X3_MARN8|nr:hypothetical protein [Marinobacter nauticus]ABM21092.1 hypothetical protein Maqu_4241 [Marinobacter nauticus VT8]
MAMGILGVLFIAVVYFLNEWWDNKNIDKSPGMLTGHSGERDANRATDEKRAKKRAKLDAKVSQLNKDNPNKLFYRDGPYVKEYSPEQIKLIRECERLNAQFAQGYHQYEIKDGQIEHMAWAVRKWKYQERCREINRDGTGTQCEFDFRNVKLINRLTGEEIPFDPESYELPSSYYSAG